MAVEILTGVAIAHVITHEVPMVFLSLLAICRICKKRWCKTHKSDI